MIRENLREIGLKIAAATQRVGRGPAEIRLIVVAKGQPVEKIREAIESGQRDFGENYAQELLAHETGVRSSNRTPAQIHWHFIGHLQRNKVRSILDKVDLIHSVDSLELAREIDRRAAVLGKIQSILIEVNVAEESSKSGVRPTEIEDLVAETSSLKNILLQGLMAIPPDQDDPEEARPTFRQLREIRDAINRKSIYQSPLHELSMGMTRDFEVAIEEGATIIRIGRAIFGERIKAAHI